MVSRRILVQQPEQPHVGLAERVAAPAYLGWSRAGGRNHRGAEPAAGLDRAWLYLHRARGWELLLMFLLVANFDGTFNGRLGMTQPSTAKRPVRSASLICVVLSSPFLFFTVSRWRDDFFRRLRLHAKQVCEAQHSGMKNDTSDGRCDQPHAPMIIAFSGKRQFTWLFTPPLKKVCPSTAFAIDGVLTVILFESLTASVNRMCSHRCGHMSLLWTRRFGCSPVQVAVLP